MILEITQLCFDAICLFAVFKVIRTNTQLIVRLQKYDKDAMTIYKHAEHMIKRK